MRTSCTLRDAGVIRTGAPRSRPAGVRRDRADSVAPPSPRQHQIAEVAGTARLGAPTARGFPEARYPCCKLLRVVRDGPRCRRGGRRWQCCSWRRCSSRRPPARRRARRRSACTAPGRRRSTSTATSIRGPIWPSPSAPRATSACWPTSQAPACARRRPTTAGSGISTPTVTVPSTRRSCTAASATSRWSPTSTATAGTSSSSTASSRASAASTCS